MGPSLGREILLDAKRIGLSDARIARETGSTERAIRDRREQVGVVPVFKSVDTCGGEFPARTPYLYSTYDEESEVEPASRPRVVILYPPRPELRGTAGGSGRPADRPARSG